MVNQGKYTLGSQFKWQHGKKETKNSCVWVVVVILNIWLKLVTRPVSPVLGKTFFVSSAQIRNTKNSTDRCNLWAVKDLVGYGSPERFGLRRTFVYFSHICGHCATGWLILSVGNMPEGKVGMHFRCSCFPGALTQLALADISGPSGAFHEHSILADFLQRARQGQC